MSGSTEHRASAPRASDRQRILSLTTARKMLSLVERIVADLLGDRKQLAAVGIERSQLDRRRRELSWPDRKRRYQLQEEIAACERRIEEYCEELAELGVALIDETSGRIGFPTLVNNRAAFFAWEPGGEIRHWHFADEIRDRAIPMAWFQQEGIAVS